MIQALLVSEKIQAEELMGGFKLGGGQRSPLSLDSIRPLAPDWLEKEWRDSERFDPSDSESRWASHGEGPSPLARACKENLLIY